MNIAVNHHRIRFLGQTSHKRADVVLAIIVHDIIGGNESRHISACLSWEIRINLPIVACSVGTMYGFVDVLGTTVISCDDEIPIAEDAIEVVQIMGCGIRRQNGVATFIDQRVHFKSVLFSCANHELPESGRASMRNRIGIECRLDDGQVLQLEWKPITLECLFKDGHIEVLCTQHQADRTAQSAAIPVDELPDDIIIRHLHHRGQLGQPLDVNLLSKFRIVVGQVTIFVLSEIVA